MQTITLDAPADANFPSAANWVPRLGMASAGVGLFGFALRTAVERSTPGLGHLAWMAAMPVTLLIAWAVCLPALYILWASKQPGVGMAHCAHAAVESLHVLGACLASTAPILWFFSVTAPESRLLAPLGFIFTGLAFVAGGVLFGTTLRKSGAAIPGGVQTLFLGLVLVTFVQFASVAHIHWF